MKTLTDLEFFEVQHKNEIHQKVENPDGTTVVYICDDCCQFENPLEYHIESDSPVGVFLAGGRNSFTYNTVPFDRKYIDDFDNAEIPEPLDFYNAIDVLAEENPEATGKEVFDSVDGISAILYCLTGEDSSSVYHFDRTTIEMDKLLEGLEEYVNERFIYYPVTKYEHGAVSFYLGNDRGWDSGLAGFILADKEAKGMKYIKDDYDWTANFKSTLNRFTEWCNGEIYTAVCFDKDGEEQDDSYLGGMYQSDIDYYENAGHSPC